MVIVIAVGAAFVTLTGFIIGWILADNHFWNRQDWTSKIEGRF